ncbi:helix-turn-helix transcriptional regulator [Candidatus Dojkabacteria bacterium]|nr:helix-turn-helix transcriptional regulator [Candidatus Dojkabacteria bacterium]
MKSKILGSKIKYFRNKAGFSQFDLESIVGFSPGSISRIENGLTMPTLGTVYKIAKALALTKEETMELFLAQKES